MVTSTIRKVDEVLDSINTHPAYSACVEKNITNALREEAAKHSLLIEENGEKYIPSNRARDEVRAQTLENINSAWNYLAKHGLSLSTLAVLGNLIEPEGHTYKNFRQKESAFGDFFPPPPEKVPYDMGALLDNLESFEGHPILRAIAAHLGLIQIHPYFDGNGRAGRLLQSFCLQQRGYPAAVIPVTDRELYITLLRSTLKDRYNFKSSIASPSDAEVALHEYIVSKVLLSAETLRQQLNARRRYDVGLSGSQSLGLLYDASQIIRNFARAHDKGVKISVNRSRKSLGIDGDIGEEEITRVLGKFARKHGVECTVIPKNC